MHGFQKNLDNYLISSLIRYRIVHSDGPPSNFNWIFVLIKVVAKSMTLRMFVVPT